MSDFIPIILSLLILILIVELIPSLFYKSELIRQVELALKETSISRLF